MNKFRDVLYRFMYGRNGVDALNWALVILELAVSVLSSIIRVQGVSQALYFVSMVLMFIVLIRIFSRNLARRQAENAKNIGKVELTCPKCGKKKVVKT